MTYHRAGFDHAGFDHLDPATAPRAHELLRDLRATCPVSRSEHHGGFYVVTRLDDLATVGRDHTRFSARTQAIGASTLLPGLETAVAPLFEQDPPEHTEVRRSLAPYFSKAAVDRWAPHIRTAARAVLADVAPRGSADLVTDVARQIPPVVIAVVLDVAPERRPRLRELLLGAIVDGDAAPYLRFLTEEVRLRRGQAGDDPLSAVVSDPALPNPTRSNTCT